jgi:metal-sulfur cluster biosynthetic enzyme
MLNVKPRALEEAVWQALGTVIDPELGLPITDLGLVYRVEAAAGVVTVVMTTTTPICPLGSYLAGLARSRVEDLAGVSEVDVHLTNEPPWTIDRMTAQARSQLGCA